MKKVTKYGKLEVICGPMWSGKSSELLKRLRKHLIIKKECVLIIPDIETRYGEKTLCTHDKETPKESENLTKKVVKKDVKGITITWNHLIDYEELSIHLSTDVVFIDEGQFFPNLINICEMLVKNGKNVIVAALDMDYKKKPFKHIATLMAKANNVTKLHALCHKCGKKAYYSERFSEETEKEVVGGSDKYRSCCIECFDHDKVDYDKSEIIISESEIVEREIYFSEGD